MKNGFYPICLLGFMSVVICHAQDLRSMSPFKDSRLLAPTATPSSIDPETGERIFTLDTITVRPIVTNLDHLIDQLALDADQFNTESQWDEQLRYSSAFEQFLNAYTLPIIGISRASIAKMYGTDYRIGKQLKFWNDVALLNDYDDSTIMEDRYYLMQLKREAITLGKKGSTIWKPGE